MLNIHMALFILHELLQEYLQSLVDEVVIYTQINFVENNKVVELNFVTLFL